jgi:hypothetical protein
MRGQQPKPQRTEIAAQLTAFVPRYLWKCCAYLCAKSRRFEETREKNFDAAVENAQHLKMRITCMFSLKNCLNGFCIESGHPLSATA